MASLSTIIQTGITIAIIMYLFFYFNNRYYLFEYFQGAVIAPGSNIDRRDCAASGGVYKNGTCVIPKDADKVTCESSGGTWDNDRCSIPSIQCNLIGGTYTNGNCTSNDPNIKRRIACEMNGGTYSLSTGVCKEDASTQHMLGRSLYDSSAAGPMSLDGAKGNEVSMTTDNTGAKLMFPGVDVQMTTLSPPYDQQHIQDLGDYELSQVYTNESDKVLSKELRDKLMSQYPMNWTTYPPSSTQFQAGYKESFQNATQDVPDDAKPYQNISGATMAPPDMGATEKEERKILQTYKPAFPPTAATYDERDANTLIKKIYDAKGLIPVVNHKEGTNVYEIVGTRRKNEKVVYEDEEGLASTKANPVTGEGVVPVVAGLNELTTSSRDSFYSPGQGSSANPWNYTAWTPGLERVFAPTEAKQSWY